MAKVTLSNIWHYIVGNIRYKLYYSRYKRFIPPLVIDQIEHRIWFMNKECYNSGSCIKCGCRTTHLQMCNKVCDGDCYPPIMKDALWFKYLRWEEVKVGIHRWQIAYDRNTKSVVLYKDGTIVNTKGIYDN